MRDVPKLTYGRLLNAMRSTIQWSKAGKCELKGQELVRDTRQQYAQVLHQLYRALINIFITHRNLHEVDSKWVLQEPQLSSSEKFDICSKSILM